jgi:lysophospholipase L1-like esterase
VIGLIAPRAHSHPVYAPRVRTLRGLLAAAAFGAAFFAVQAQPALAGGKIFHVEYSGTVTETAQPDGREGNSYSESVKFALTRTGTLEQLAQGEGSHELSASGQLSAAMANKPPMVPPSTCQENVAVGGGVPVSTILNVAQDGSVGAQLNALLADLTPQAAGREDFCWVDSDYQWLLLGAPFPGASFSTATLPITTTNIDTGTSRPFDFTGSTAPNRATLSIKTKISVPGAYTALGDSYSAGEGAGDYYPDTLAPPKGTGCDRSQNAYPVLLARDLGYPLDGFVSAQSSFAACSGARTGAISKPFKDETAQIDHVHENDSLITISIGGNDIGFAPVVTDCLQHPDCGTKEEPAVRRALAVLTGEIPGVLELLRDKAPDARVVVVGYPNFMPATGGCRPSGGILHYLIHMPAANVEFIHTAIEALDRDTAHVVEGHSNMVYVRPDPRVWGRHTICSRSSWFVKVDLSHALTHSAVFFHPTAEGQRELEREVLPAAR